MMSNEGLDTDIFAIKERPQVYGIFPKNIAYYLFVDPYPFNAYFYVS